MLPTSNFQLYFREMRWLISALIFVTVIAGCKNTESVSKAEKETFEIEITLTSEEAVKRVPYNHATIELRLKTALEEHGQYAATITVFPDQVDQIIEKLATQDGVGNVLLIGSSQSP